MYFGLAINDLGNEEIRMKKCISIVLTLIMVFVSVACNSGDRDKGNAASTTLDMSSEDYVCGNADVEDLYFTSKYCTVPCRCYKDAYKRPDDFILVGEKITEDNCSFLEVYTISMDCELLSTVDIESTDQALIPLCDWNSQYLVASSYISNDLILFEYSGNEVSRITPSIDDTIYSAIGLEDGLVVCSNTCAVRYDNDLNETGRIYFDVELTFTPRLFLQKGNLYVASGIGYHRLDFETETASYISIQTKYEGESVFGAESGLAFFLENIPSFDMFWDDNFFWETDVEAKEIYKVAKRSNIMRMPPRFAYTSFASSNNYLVLDKEHYVAIYNYNDTEYYDVADVVLISADRDAGFKDREKIVVQGNYIMHDDCIQRAAYIYNMSQDDHFVELQSIGDEYDLSISDQANAFRVNTLADYQNGNTPDIYYGDIFDYIYWGDNGMVLDMSPYIHVSDTVFPNIRDAMTDGEGHIYQVFSSFWIYGLWGRQSGLQSADLTADELMQIQNITDSGLKVTSSELLDGMVGYNLSEIYRSGNLTQDNISSIVNSVTARGSDEHPGGTVVTGDEYSQATDMSDLVLQGVLNTTDYVNLSESLHDIPVLAGFPSVDSQVRVLGPHGLVAVSSGASDPQACCDFISVMLSDEFQSYMALSYGFSIDRKVMERHLSYLEDPSSIPSDVEPLYQGILLRNFPDPDRNYSEVVSMEPGMKEALIEQISKLNTVWLYDWGVRDIINEELRSYYSQGKSADEVASSLCSRLLVYAQENYG